MMVATLFITMPDDVVAVAAPVAPPTAPPSPPPPPPLIKYDVTGIGYCHYSSAGLHIQIDVLNMTHWAVSPAPATSIFNTSSAASYVGKNGFVVILEARSNFTHYPLSTKVVVDRIESNSSTTLLHLKRPTYSQDEFDRLALTPVTNMTDYTTRTHFCTFTLDASSEYPLLGQVPNGKCYNGFDATADDNEFYEELNGQLPPSCFLANTNNINQCGYTPLTPSKDHSITSFCANTYPYECPKSLPCLKCDPGYEPFAEQVYPTGQNIMSACGGSKQYCMYSCQSPPPPAPSQCVDDGNCEPPPNPNPESNPAIGPAVSMGGAFGRAAINALL